MSQPTSQPAAMSSGLDDLLGFGGGPTPAPQASAGLAGFGDISSSAAPSTAGFHTPAQQVNVILIHRDRF